MDSEREPETKSGVIGLRVTGGPTADNARVWLGGQEITRGLRGLDVHLGLDGPARATFDVVAPWPLELDLLATVSGQPRREPVWRRLAAAWARITRRPTTIVEITGLGDAARTFRRVTERRMREAVQRAVDQAAASAREDSFRPYRYQVKSGPGPVPDADLPEPAGAPHPMVGATRKLAAALEDCRRSMANWQVMYAGGFISGEFEMIKRRHQEAFAIAGALAATAQAERDAEARHNDRATRATRPPAPMTEAERDASFTHARPDPTTGPPTRRGRALPPVPMTAAERAAAETVEVFSRDDCPFQYCEAPERCRSLGRCFHTPQAESPA